MRWATRAGVHIDRAACAWLIRRFIDPDAEFAFVADPAQLPAGATAFDIRGADLSHHGADCSFETILRRYDLADPVLWRIAQVVHEADVDDQMFDAPEAPGLDVALRGLSMTCTDDRVLELTGPLFDGLYEYWKRAVLLGREPALPSRPLKHGSQMITNQEQGAPRIGVLWRGDRRADAPLPRADRGLGPLYDVLAAAGAAVVPVPYSDDAVDDVRKELLALDGVLVWVNPIQDGASRALLDPLLREASAQGVWVSARPDVILRMGTKEVLYRTRHLGWGSDTGLYQSAAEFAARFPARLARLGRLVLKQARGNGGNGVWKVELSGGSPGPAGSATLVRVQDARSRDGSSEPMTLGAFMRRCEDYFAWSGSLIDQAYQDRLADGMVRCYFTGLQVTGFGRQWPKGLLDGPQDPAPATVMQGPDAPEWQALRQRAETEWVPQMTGILGISPEELPAIWDADFLFGPKATAGDDTYVLCEINVSAVWPFPPAATTAIAAAALDHARAARALRPSAPVGTGGNPGQQPGRGQR